MRAIRLAIWCGALSALAQALAAQTPEVIRDIHIDTRPVFDSADAQSPFFRVLNFIHVTTRSSVVRENLTIRPGDRVDSAALAESARTLRALGIFRSVTIDTTPAPEGVNVGVTTHDAWTTNPQIHIQTSGSQATLGGGIRETNFLGTNTILDGEYTKDPDRSTVALSGSRPRLIAGIVGVDVDYQGRSDGTVFDATASAPFFQLTTRSAASLNGQLIDARVLQFVGGDPTPARQVRQRSDALVASGGVALSASDAGYLRLGLTAQLRSDGFRPESATGPFSRPVAAALGPYLEYRRTNFYSTRGYQAFGRDEDVDLGLTVRVAAALAPSQWGYPRGGVGPSISVLAGTRIPLGFVQANVQADGLLTGAGVDSGTVTGGVSAVFQGGTRHLGIVHIEGGAESHPYPGEEFDLGLGYGARAYDIHAFTGDRMYIAGAEYRYIIVPNALGMEAIGVSVFADRAGAWYVGSPVRSGTDVGIGVRFGSLRSPTGGMVRIDLAYRAATAFEPAKWVLVVGKGFAFNVR